MDAYRDACKTQEPNAHPAFSLPEQMLRESLGAACSAALADSKVTDVDLNSRGELQVKRNGRYTVIETVDYNRAERIVSVISNLVGVPVTAENPRWNGRFPLGGMRCSITIPPAAAAPTLHLRTKPATSPSLAGLVASGMLTPGQARHIEGEICERRNVILAGLPGSGKTTVARALVAVMAQVPWRCIIVDPLDEYESLAPNIERLHPAKGSSFSPIDALDQSLLIDPEAVSFAEVRTGEDGVQLVRTWLAGTTGGFCTVHTDDAAGVFVRFEDFYREQQLVAVRRDLLRVIHTIVHLRAEWSGATYIRRAGEVVRVVPHDENFTLDPVL
ncbi:hypothetical protein EPN42_13130 [bacterium]|nr:MAG: hypothetical protein EPN42_13130 [bacterium]